MQTANAIALVSLVFGVAWKIQQGRIDGFKEEIERYKKRKRPKKKP
jgi:hypothetical protein